jgi:hypothetical protein
MYKVLEASSASVFRQGNHLLWWTIYRELLKHDFGDAGSASLFRQGQLLLW